MSKCSTQRSTTADARAPAKFCSFRVIYAGGRHCASSRTLMRSNLGDRYPHPVADLGACGWLAELETGGEYFAGHHVAVRARPVRTFLRHRHHNRDAVGHLKTGRLKQVLEFADAVLGPAFGLQPFGDG